LVVSLKAFFCEEDAIDGADHPLDVARAFDALDDGAGPVVDLTEVASDVETGMIFLRDHERCFDEIEHRIGKLRELPEALACNRGMRQDTCGAHHHLTLFETVRLASATPRRSRLLILFSSRTA